MKGTIRVLSFAFWFCLVLEQCNNSWGQRIVVQRNRLQEKNAIIRLFAAPNLKSGNDFKLIDTPDSLQNEKETANFPNKNKRNFITSTNENILKQEIVFAKPIKSKYHTEIAQFIVKSFKDYKIKNQVPSNTKPQENTIKGKLNINMRNQVEDNMPTIKQRTSKFNFSEKYRMNENINNKRNIKNFSNHKINIYDNKTEVQNFSNHEVLKLNSSRIPDSLSEIKMKDVANEDKQIKVNNCRNKCQIKYKITENRRLLKRSIRNEMKISENTETENVNSEGTNKSEIEERRNEVSEDGDAEVFSYRHLNKVVTEVFENSTDRISIDQILTFSKTNGFNETTITETFKSSRTTEFDNKKTTETAFEKTLEKPETQSFLNKMIFPDDYLKMANKKGSTKNNIVGSTRNEVTIRVKNTWRTDKTGVYTRPTTEHFAQAMIISAPIRACSPGFRRYQNKCRRVF